VTPGEQRTLSSVQAELARLARYDDESVVHDAWIRQRYAGGYTETYAPARKDAVATAWHEAGHAVAALAVGARFSSASIRAGGRSAGRVHSITGGGQDRFVIAAGGQVAEGLRGWTLPASEAEVLAWLASWRGDGGDARRFRSGLAGTRFAGDEAGAWRYCADLLTPLRSQIRSLARGLLAWPRHLPFAVAAELAGFGAPARQPSSRKAAGGTGDRAGRAC
jgi:Peptidase M50B-like